MTALRHQFDEFAKTTEDICSYISVREDKNGPFIFAFGLKSLHSLQLRKIAECYVLELWKGRNALEEVIVSKPEFANIQSAFDCAKNWLSKDITDI